MHTDRSTLDDVEFLVRSSNRLDVLDAIRTDPRTRHELRERTDASRVTLSRILSDLEERGWAERRGDRYVSTREGAVVAGELERLFANLEAADGLNGALRWLPVEQFDFDLARLANATVVASTSSDLTAAITHTVRVVRESRRVRNVATGVSSEVLDAYLEAASHEGRSLETVVHEGVFDAVADDAALRHRLRDLLAADTATVRRHCGEEPPVMLTICDDRVLICGQPDDRSPPEGVESRDEVVRDWAAAYFDRLRANSTPVDPDAFTA